MPRWPCLRTAYPDAPARMPWSWRAPRGSRRGSCGLSPSGRSRRRRWLRWPPASRRSSSRSCRWDRSFLRWTGARRDGAQWKGFTASTATRSRPPRSSRRSRRYGNGLRLRSIHPVREAAPHLVPRLHLRDRLQVAPPGRRLAEDPQGRHRARLRDRVRIAASGVRGLEHAAHYPRPRASVRDGAEDGKAGQEGPRGQRGRRRHRDRGEPLHPRLPPQHRHHSHRAEQFHLRHDRRAAFTDHARRAYGNHDAVRQHRPDLQHPRAGEGRGSDVGGAGDGVPRPGPRQADHRRHRTQGTVGARDHQRLSHDPRAPEQVPEPHGHAFVDEGYGASRFGLRKAPSRKDRRQVSHGGSLQERGSGVFRDLLRDGRAPSEAERGEGGVTMSGRYEIRFSGSGGQGLILAGVIFAEAATIYDKINAVQSQSYGPEARGGASKAEVIISEEVIDFPKATAIDLQLSLTQESCNKYYKDIKPGGILLVDEDFVRDIPQGNFKVIKLPIIRTASEEIGKAFVANIVATGAITAITGKVKIESVEKAVLSRVPKGTEEMNKKALRAGYDMAKARMN